jgi:hypothetical protein
LHAQVLDGDRLVVADQRRGELVVEVAAGIGHPGVGAGNPDPGLAPVPASLKYLPAESLITVTDDGSDGNGRDHRTGTSPIFGSLSVPLGSTRNRVLAVNRMACR